MKLSHPRGPSICDCQIRSVQSPYIAWSHGQTEWSLRIQIVLGTTIAAIKAITAAFSILRGDATAFRLSVIVRLMLKKLTMRGRSTTLPPCDGLFQSFPKRRFRSPFKRIIRAIDGQHRNRHIERPSRLPMNFQFLVKYIFNRCYDLAKTMACTAADIEDASAALVIGGGDKSVDHVIDKDEIAHHRAVAPDLNFL